jgi:hypothetical protein
MKLTINLLTPLLLFRTSRAYATLNMGIPDQFRVSPFENEFSEDGAAGAEASANLLDRRSDGYLWSEERTGFPDAERSTDIDTGSAIMFVAFAPLTRTFQKHTQAWLKANRHTRL